MINNNKLCVHIKNIYTERQIIQVVTLKFRRFVGIENRVSELEIFDITRHKLFCYLKKIREN